MSELRAQACYLCEDVESRIVDAERKLEDYFGGFEAAAVPEWCPDEAFRLCARASTELSNAIDLLRKAIDVLKSPPKPRLSAVK
jgi:hypothetical protein